MIDNYRQEKLALEDYFNTQWAGLTPIAWPDIRFNPAGYDEFIRFNILPSDAVQVTPGSQAQIKQFRYTGLIEVQIFNTYNDGLQLAISRADSVCSIFNRAGIEYIVINAPSMNIIGLRGGWHQVNVTCEYSRDSYQASAT